MSILATLLNTSTTAAHGTTAGLWGRTDADAGWVDLDSAEYLAGRIDAFELQMDLTTGDIVVVEDGEAAEVIEMGTFKPINKTTTKGDREYRTLFSFHLDDKEVTVFLNTAQKAPHTGHQYFGLAWAKAAPKASARKRVVG